MKNIHGSCEDKYAMYIFYLKILNNFTYIILLGFPNYKSLLSMIELCLESYLAMNSDTITVYKSLRNPG